MDRAYDIFEKYRDGSVQRRAEVVGLGDAIIKVEALAKLSANEFFILSTDTQEIAHRADGTKPAWPRSPAENN
jgi:hypothetical protein